MLCLPLFPAPAVLHNVTDERFHELDVNEDGTVSFKEFLFAYVQWVSEKHARERGQIKKMSAGRCRELPPPPPSPARSRSPSAILTSPSFLQVGLDDEDKEEEHGASGKKSFFASLLGGHGHGHHNHNHGTTSAPRSRSGSMGKSPE